MLIQNGKVIPKELTEEEKEQAADAGKGKGKPPPKDAKKAAEAEPTPEEKERMEKEEAERQEREAKLKEEWDKLDEETKHLRTSEDIFKEPCIKMQNLVTLSKVEALEKELAEVPEDEENQPKRDEIQLKIDDLIGDTNVGRVICTKESYEIVEMEEAIRAEGGCWLRFMKLPPVADPADAGKKAPPKGKGAVAEDLKPVFGKAWVNFKDLAQPGATELKQRVYLETCAPIVKKANEEGVEEEVEESEFDKVFEEARSYIHLRIQLSNPIVPPTPDRPEPKPTEIVGAKQFITWPYSKEPTDDFCKQVTLATESLAKEFYNLFGQENAQNMNRTEMNNEKLAQIFED